MKPLTEKDVAVVVPLSSRETLTEAEEISLRHLRTYLHRYDKYFVAPKKLSLDKIDITGFEIIRFADKFFGSVRAHNKLMTNHRLYRSLSQYKFILVYHLDSLVFSDQLIEWCEKDYDFIAPPWFSTELNWIDTSGVGNGGFSIRKVDSFIRLYSSKENYWMEPHEFAGKVAARVPIPVINKLVYHASRQMSKIKLLNNVRVHRYYYLDIQDRGEDIFVSLYGKHYLPDFKIPTPEKALEFAFEVNPRKCYEMNNNKMPFGCHAFERYDLSFWEPHMIKS